MSKQNGLLQRGRTFYFQARIPKDCVAHFSIPGGPKRTIIRERLSAATHAEAKAQVRQKWAELEARIAEIRRPPGEATARRTMSPEEAQRIAAHVVAHVLQHDEESRMAGRSQDECDDLDRRLQQAEAEDRNAIARGQFEERLLIAAEDWMRVCGYELPLDSPEFRRLAYEIAKASRAATEAYRARDRGDLVPTPASPMPEHTASTQGAGVHAVPGGKHHLSDALAIWQRLKRPAPSTVEIYQHALRDFECRNESLHLEAITRAHIRTHIRALQEEGKSAKTIEKQHGALRALLSIAEHEEWIPSNPARGVMLPAVQSSGIRSFTADELQRIFDSDVFTKGTRPRAGKGEAAFWLPLLLLYTGARREELAQLSVDRVRTSDGVHYLAIDPAEDGGRLKTAESRRSIPIHSQLVRLGFLDYVASRRKAGGPLFAGMKANKRGQVGAKWGDWWRRYVRETVGLTDERIHPAHSFRHLFITECRRLHIREDYERALVGHVRNGGRKDAHDSYGEHLVSALAEVVERIEFRGLNLSQLMRVR